MEKVIKNNLNSDETPLDLAIKTEKNLQCLNVLLEAKLKYLREAVPSNKISFEISHIYIDENDIELIKEVLIKALVVHTNSKKEITEILSYIKQYSDKFECKLKLLNLLDVVFRYCNRTNEFEQHFDHDTCDFIIKFILSNVEHDHFQKSIHEILLYLYPLLPRDEKLSYVNKIFDFCQEICNLDILCLILNDIPSDIVIENLCCFNTDKFWYFLSNSLTCDENNLHKQVIYILLIYLNKFNTINTNKYLKTEHSSEESWNAFFLLLDIGKEKQLHLVEPAIDLFKYINNFHFIWQKCVYKIYLSHSQSTISNKTVTFLIKQQYQKENLNEIFDMMLPAMNKFDYNENITEMYAAFQNFALIMKKDSFELLLEKLLHIPWNPVSLWKVLQSIFVTENKIPISIDYFQELIGCVVKIPHTFIKNECIKFLINFFWDDKSFFKIYRMARALKKYTSNFELYIKTCHVSEEIVDFVINELLVLGENYEDTDKIQICFILLEKLHYDIAPTVIGKHIHKLSSLIKLNVWQYYLSSLKSNKNDFCTHIDQFIPEYFKEHLNSDSAKCFLNVLILLNDTKEDFMSKYIGIMTEACLKPWTFTKTQTHICMAFLNRHPSELFRPASNYNPNYTVGQEIIDTWKHKISKERDVNICMEYINLLFVVHKEGFNANDTVETVELFKTLFDYHSNEVISHIFKKLSIFMELSSSPEVVFEFMNFCFEKFGCLKRDSYFKDILVHFINAIHLEQYFSRNINNVHCVNINLLEYCEMYPIIRLNLILAIKKIVNEKHASFFGSLIPTVVALYLQGIISTKEERTEYNICQEFIRLTTDSTTFEISEFSDQSNPNIIKATCKILALETVLNMAKYNNLDVITCLRGEYLKYFKKRYFPNSEVHIKKLRIAQALLLLVPHVRQFSREAIQIGVFLLDCFLEESNQMCVKQFYNWTLILLLQDAAFAGIEYIKRVTSISSSVPTSVMTGLIPAFYHLALFDSEDPTRSFTAVLKLALPWTMGAQFKLRLYAQDIIRRIIHEAKENNYQDFLNKYGHLEDCIDSCIKGTGKSYENTLKTDLVFLNYCNPISDYSLKTILVDIPKLNSISSPEWENIFPCILNLNYSGYLERLSDKTPLEPKDQSFATAADSYIKNFTGKNEPSQDITPNLNIQKKITPWKNAEDASTSANFILVTSLIEKPQNIGGLSRTCEAFGIRSVVFKDAKIVNNKEFQSLSMSSEGWINAIEVKKGDLRQYISACRKDGYCVIGAEQTTNSIKLNEYQFPIKTVLLLGNEKTGIPADLIPLLDACVEIPQFGQTRSLNVHVAGATLIWEYVKQHSFQKAATAT